MRMKLYIICDNHIHDRTLILIDRTNHSLNFLKFLLHYMIIKKAGNSNQETPALKLHSLTLIPAQYHFLDNNSRL